MVHAALVADGSIVLKRLVPGIVETVAQADLVRGSRRKIRHESAAVGIGDVDVLARVLCVADQRL